MEKILCDICGKASLCLIAEKVIKKKELDDFDSSSYDFCNNNRTFFNDQAFVHPYKPIKSVDILTYNQKTNEVFLVEIKKVNVATLRSLLQEIKNKYIDSLYVLSFLHPKKTVRKFTIAIPDTCQKINRIRSSIRAFFPRTLTVDSVYYFRNRGSLFSEEGKQAVFSYSPFITYLKNCKDAL